MRPPADLAEAAHLIQAARSGLIRAMTFGRDAALAAIANGATEVAVAKALGVNRTTIRRWAGK